MQDRNPRSGQVRAIFDATIIGVNDNIRANTEKKTTDPTLFDLLVARSTLEGSDFTLFKPDVSKAHRCNKVTKKRWRYMIAAVKDKFWVNMVGAYGVASAQLYGEAWRPCSLAWLTTSHLDLRLSGRLFGAAKESDGPS